MEATGEGRGREETKQGRKEGRKGLDENER